MAMVNIQDAQSCLLWEDLWDNRVPLHTFPEMLVDLRLFSICLSLSQIAFQQLEALALSLNNLHVTQELDTWTYI